MIAYVKNAIAALAVFIRVKNFSHSARKLIFQIGATTLWRSDCKTSSGAISLRDNKKIFLLSFGVDFISCKLAAVESYIRKKSKRIFVKV